MIAGQSNSAGYGKDDISDCLDAGVHLLKNNGKWDIASHPMNDSTGTIHPQNRDGANTGHGMYLSFAKYLKRELGYPIGLVQASLGGSPLKAWSAYVQVHGAYEADLLYPPGYRQRLQSSNAVVL